MSIAMLIALVGFPFLFAVILHKNRGTLNSQEMKDKIGSLYLGMRTNTWIQRLYSSVFLFRRLMYCILTIVCIQQPNILIHVFLLTNIIYVTYLGYSDVNDTQLARRMEFFNEMGLQMITYHLALFPLCLTLEGEELLGWSMIAFVGFVFLGNVTVMVVIAIKAGIRKLYLRKLKNMTALKVKQLRE